MTTNSRNSATILIVDDNPNNLRVLGGMLQQAGYKVRPALSGPLALRSIQSNPPDLVLLDIRMPGMDGYQVCQRIKEDPASAEIPVIFISALQEASDKVVGFKAGAVDYIVKPFQIEEVLARVEAHTELAQARRELRAAHDSLEQQVVERTQDLLRSQGHLQQAVAREHSLTELLQLALRLSSIPDYLRASLRLLRTHLDQEQAENRLAVFLPDDAAPPGLVLAAHCGVGEDPQVADGELALRLGLCEPVATTIMEAQLSNYATRCAGEAEGDRPGSGCLCIPLVSGERRLGVLRHRFPYRQDPDPALLAFLRRAGDMLSMGLVRRQDAERIEYLAFHDELTNLPNRHVFRDRLDQELRRVKRHGEVGAVLFLDLDRFKNMNDALGHSVGDSFLLLTSQRLFAALRAEDSICRWGGDEFLVLLPVLGKDMDSAISNANLVAEKLIETVSLPTRILDHELQLTASIGIALFTDQLKRSEDLIKFADTALFLAKQAGRNRISFYEATMQETVERRLMLERDMRRCVEGGQLFLLYQPQVEGPGAMTGVETLVRWRHPVRGLVMPGEFIAIAEDSGLIVPIGHWVLQDGLRQLRAWRDRLPASVRPPTLSVNVSSRQFYEKDFTERVEQAITEAGVDPDWVELEVTEGMLLQDIQDTVRKMTRLRNFGVSFAIDDFGTGYSSLSYLKRLPLSRLKIDQSFVRDVHKDSQDAAIVATIIAMARSLNLDVIAEGVETREEIEFLRGAGCDAFQGYFFGKPMPAEEIDARWDLSTGLARVDR